MVIEQVEGVCDPDNPQEGQHDVKRERLGPSQAVAKEEQHRCYRDLHNELRGCSKGPDVVYRAEDEDYADAQQGQPLLPERFQQRHSSQKRRRDGRPAHRGRRPLVPAVVTWVLDVAESVSRKAVQRVQRQRKRQTEEKVRGDYSHTMWER